MESRASGDPGFLTLPDLVKLKFLRQKVLERVEHLAEAQVQAGSSTQ